MTLADQSVAVPCRRHDGALFTPALRRNLVVGFLILLVTIRFLTEVFHLFPRAFNFLDVPALIVLVAAASVCSARRMPPPSVTVLTLGLIFFNLSLLSALLNLSRVAVAPVALFLYGFLGPLVAYRAAYRLWPPGSVGMLSRVLVTLGLSQLAVVFTIDLPRFLTSRNPDDFSGTFGENPYQMVFFLIVFLALVAGIFTFEGRRLAAKLAPALFLVTLGAIFLAQYRALLISTALSLLVIGVLVGRDRGKGRVSATLVALAFAIALPFVAAQVKATKLDQLVNALSSNPGFLIKERLGAAGDVMRMFTDHPIYIFTGSGPGTFSSRAWQTFAQIDSTSSADVAGPYVRRLTADQPYHSDVADQYVVPGLQGSLVFQGSRALTSPFASYYSLLAEGGVFGLFLMVALYVMAAIQAGRMTVTAIRTRTHQDPLPGVLLAATVSLCLLLQMAFLGNWLEVARITVPAWLLFAVGAKEFHARRRTDTHPA